MTEVIVFWFFAIVMVAAAIMTLVSRNMVHSAFWLVLVLLGVAVMFIFSLAEFVALVQILIYAAGILILIIFGLMLSSRLVYQRVGDINLGNRVTGLVISLLTLAIHFYVIISARFEEQRWIQDASLKADSGNLFLIGKSLIAEYAVSFELAGLLLLVVIIAAAAIVGRMLKEVRV